jgi:flagellar motor switch protein FliN/FliY
LPETIEYEQFEQGAHPDAGAASEVDLSRLSDIPMELSVEIGRTHMTVGETLDLRVGSVVTLERLAGETADLLVNGSAIARGEVVVIDEQYGLRITEILDGQSDSELSEPSAAAGTQGAGDGAPAGQSAPAEEGSAGADSGPAADSAAGGDADAAAARED